MLKGKWYVKRTLACCVNWQPLLFTCGTLASNVQTLVQSEEHTQSALGLVVVTPLGGGITHPI